MMAVAHITGAVLCLVGSILFFIAALGIIRMPDLYNRMQSGSKCTALGSFLFIMGIGISEPEFIGKTILLILFIVFTNPISFHSLARAAHYIGIPLADATF
ncbi:MAG TPA: monovalent cation/H(+) antiporter subunit G, partial [candidate division Zixibacteria bacterium]|nr:monovalent cation/H(+) antiporter subunit G [candidate division Zixibacteria bacterium]